MILSTNCGSGGDPWPRATNGDVDGVDVGDAGVGDVRPSRGSSAQVFNMNLKFRVTLPSLVLPLLSPGKPTFRIATPGLSSSGFFSAMTPGATTWSAARFRLWLSFPGYTSRS